MPATHKVNLLGPFTVSATDGTEAVLPKKARALLAFLVVNRGRRLQRDELATLLWSNTGSEQARQSLRQCVSVMRRIVDPSVINDLDARSDTLTFRPASTIVSDVAALERLRSSTELQDLEAAVALFRGEFLAGLNLAAEPFQEWMDTERRCFAAIRTDLLTTLAGRHASAGDLAGAIRTAKQLTAVDPCCEESSRMLMQYLAAGGRRPLALMEYTRIERVLRAELELAPDLATRAIADSVRRSIPPDAQNEHDPDAGVRNKGDIGKQQPVARAGYTYADRARIALLPFSSLAVGTACDDFATALTEDVAARLVGERWPVVVTTADRDDAGRPATSLDDITTRIDCLVTASVRRDDRHVRVMIRLTDAATGQHLWWGRVDAEAQSLFALQDQLSLQVVARLAPAIRTAEIGRVNRKPLEELTTYELYLRASAICRQGAAGNAAALRILKRAIDLDPKFALAHGLAARCFHLRRLMGWSAPADPDLYHGVKLAHRAMDLEDDNPEALWMSGLAMAIIDGNMRDGHHLIGRSLAISQSNASAWIASCFAHAHSGDATTAIEHFHRAQSVNSGDDSQHLQWHAAATAHFIAGHYDEAECATDNALQQAPGYPGALRMKIALAGRTGRTGQAEDAARRLLRVNPDATIAGLRDYWQPMMPYTPDAIAAMIDGWQRAGMPSG